MAIDRIVLTQQFGEYLEKYDTSCDLTPTDTVDLFTLFTTLASLDAEVKRETRYIKQALNDFKAVFQTLEASHTSLQKELNDKRDAHKEIIAQSLRPLLEDLIEYRRLFETATQQLKTVFSTKPRWWQKWKRKNTASSSPSTVIAAHELLLKRLDTLLEQQQVYRMECVGKLFDPIIMRAIRVENNPTIMSGAVLSEDRSGYYWKGHVLQYADVVVNRWGNEHA